jgi:putative methyltransferase (TIGR04325 family)
MLRPSSRYGFHGNFESWEKAKKHASGYEDLRVFEKVKQACLAVKDSSAVFERDSVLFDNPQYRWPVLSALLLIASRQDNRLNVLDFGGSLGSSYCTLKRFLMHLMELQWNIVEQSHFVEFGKENFEDNILKFYHSFQECVKKTRPDVILCSTVIQYLENPYAFLTEVLEAKIKYVIIDRTPFLKNGNDRLTVQKVPPNIYNASYPAWFFNRDNFCAFFKVKYSLVAEFEAEDSCNIPATFKGFLFERR